MNRITLLFVGLIAASPALAQVYQYKDAAGRTVYTDQPPAGAATKSRSGSGDAAGASAAPSESKSAADKELEFRKRQKEQQEASTKREKEAANKAARMEDCERARKNLRIFESGERVATRDEKGERVFLDDDQRAAEAEKARKAVADLCR